MRFLIAAAIVPFLASCATVTKEECLTGNWREIGFRDGTEGRTTDFIQRHAKACSRVEVVPDPVAWETGRQAGLPAYCVPSKAYSVGRSGGSVSPVCSPDVMPTLRAANEKGRRYYDLTSDINSVRSEIGQLEFESGKTDDAGKKLLILQQIRTLEERIRLLEDRRRPFSSL